MTDLQLILDKIDAELDPTNFDTSSVIDTKIADGIDLANTYTDNNSVSS